MLLPDLYSTKGLWSKQRKRHQYYDYGDHNKSNETRFTAHRTLHFFYLPGWQMSGLQSPLVGFLRPTIKGQTIGFNSQVKSFFRGWTTAPI